MQMTWWNTHGHSSCSINRAVEEFHFSVQSTSNIEPKSPFQMITSVHRWKVLKSTSFELHLFRLGSFGTTKAPFSNLFSHVINPRCGDVFHNQNEAWHKVEQSQSNVTFYMSHERCFDNHGIMWQRIAFSIPVRWWMIVSSSHLLILTLSLQVGNFLWV